MRLNKIIFGIFACAYIAYANPLEPKNFTAPTQQELVQQQAQGGKQEDLSDLKTNEFYLNLTSEDIKNMQDKDKEIREAFDGFSQKEINYKPVIRPFCDGCFKI